MEILLNKIYKVKEECREECVNFNDESDAMYVKVIEIDVDDNLYYDILDEDKRKISKCNSCFEPSHLIPLVKTFETLEKGDVVVDSNADKRTVIERLGDLVAISYVNNSEAVANWWHYKELEKSGWAIEQPEEEKEEVEMTVGQVAEKLGISNLKIVKE